MLLSGFLHLGEASSKASTVEDLQHAATYGFRGEALYSLGMTSLLEIQSRCAGKEAHAKVQQRYSRATRLCRLSVLMIVAVLASVWYDPSCILSTHDNGCQWRAVFEWRALHCAAVTFGILISSTGLGAKMSGRNENLNRVSTDPLAMEIMF